MFKEAELEIILFGRDDIVTTSVVDSATGTMTDDITVKESTVGLDL